jgi:hypothetical protein
MREDQLKIVIIPAAPFPYVMLPSSARAIKYSVHRRPRFSASSVRANSLGDDPVDEIVCKP